MSKYSQQSGARGNGASNGNRNRPVQLVGTLDALSNGKGKLRCPDGSEVLIELDPDRANKPKRPQLNAENFNVSPDEGELQVWVESALKKGTVTGESGKEYDLYSARWVSKLHPKSVILPHHVTGGFQTFDTNGSYRPFLLDSRAGAHYDKATTESMTEALGLAYDRAIADREVGVDPAPDGAMIAIATGDTIANADFEGVTWNSLFTRGGSGDENEEFVLKTRDQFIESGFKAQLDNPHVPIKGRPTVGAGLDDEDEPAQVSVMVGRKNGVMFSKHLSDDPSSAGFSFPGSSFVEMPEPNEGYSQMYRFGHAVNRMSGLMNDGPPKEDPERSPEEQPKTWARRLNGVMKFAGATLHDGPAAQQNDRKGEEDDPDAKEADAFEAAGMGAR